MDRGQGHDEKEDKMSKAFKIAKSVHYEGDGLIATCNIKAGELILQEAPIVFDKNEEGIKTAFNLMQKKHDKWLNMLPYHKDHVSENPSQFEIFKAQVSRSAFYRQNSEILKEECKYVLYLYLSKINHSCLPNATKSLPVRNAPCGVYALKDINKGEEITIYYHLSDSMFLPTNQRRHIIKTCYLFDCKCVRCIGKISNFKEDDIKKGLLFEKLLKGAVYPNTLKNANKSKRNKYVSKMKQDFDKVIKLFNKTQTALESVFGYNVNQMVDDMINIINLIQRFLNTYGNNKFLLNTHWRVIQLTQKFDIVWRWYTGLVYKLRAELEDSDSLKELLNEQYIELAIGRLMDLIRSYHELLIDNLEYDYFGSMQCCKVDEFDSWLTLWEFTHYNYGKGKSDHENDSGHKQMSQISSDTIDATDDTKKQELEDEEEDIDHDEMLRIMVDVFENGYPGDNRLTKMKNMLSLLARQEGTTLKRCIQSYKLLFGHLDKKLMMLQFASKSNFKR